MATILETRHGRWADEAECAAVAERIAARFAGPNAAPSPASVYIELHGPLGAGKTTFARHLLHALGVTGTIRSPTYTLVEPYRADAAHGATPIAHCDFYRFDDPQEWEDAGFRDVFAAPGLKLVEWPEKAEGLLPRCDLRVLIAPHDAIADADADADADPAAPRELRYEALTETGRSLLP